MNISKSKVLLKAILIAVLCFIAVAHLRSLQAPDRQKTIEWGGEEGEFQIFLSRFWEYENFKKAKDKAIVIYNSPEEMENMYSGVAL